MGAGGRFGVREGPRNSESEDPDFEGYGVLFGRPKDRVEAKGDRADDPSRDRCHC